MLLLLACADPVAFDPYRLEHFSNISRWAAAGYNVSDTSAYLQAAYDSFNHPNIVLDLRVPGTKSFRCGRACVSMVMVMVVACVGGRGGAEGWFA